MYKPSAKWDHGRNKSLFNWLNTLLAPLPDEFDLCNMYSYVPVKFESLNLDKLYHLPQQLLKFELFINW